MQKNIMLVAILCTPLMHGMEQGNTRSITVENTKINLVQGFIGDADSRVDMIVVGKNQQLKIKPSFTSFGSSYIGELFFKENCVMHKNASEKKEIMCGVVEITEPQIVELRGGILYDAVRLNSVCRVKEDDAIIEASKDLEICYKKALSEVFKKLGDKKEKSIALPVLSADIGFPKKEAVAIAVKAVFEFIKNNSKAYECIELYVSTSDEYALYERLIMQRIDSSKK